MKTITFVINGTDGKKKDVILNLDDDWNEVVVLPAIKAMQITTFKNSGGLLVTISFTPASETGFMRRVNVSRSNVYPTEKEIDYVARHFFAPEHDIKRGKGIFANTARLEAVESF